MKPKKSEWVKMLTYLVLAVLVPLGVSNPALVGAVSSIGEQIARTIESSEGVNEGGAYGH